jgi:hypothetical protein
MQRECQACGTVCKNKLHSKMLACGQCGCGDRCQNPNCQAFMEPLMKKASRPEHNIYPCLKCGYVPAWI